MANAHDLLMVQRAAMMVGKPLPYDAEVEWIGSTDAGQYINTGILMDMMDYDFEGEFSISSYKNSDTFFGIYSSNDKNEAYGTMMRVTPNRTTLQGFVQWGSSARSYESTPMPDEWNVLRSRQDGFFLNGTKFLAISPKPYLFTNPACWIALFGRRDYRSGADDVFTPANYARCRWFRYSKGGVLLRDFVPVKKDGVGYMFDRCGSICPLTGTSLFANAGTGVFIIGPDKT